MTNHIVMKNGQAYIESKQHLKAEMVARMYADGNQMIEAVMEHYGLTAAEVHSAIAYYYDNQPELDAAYNQTLVEIRNNAMNLSKFKNKIGANK